MEDLPIGETEEVKRKMGEILDYDAALYREYRKGLISVQVFITYWGAGKEHFRAVYGHTPDVCWVRAGWRPKIRDSAYHFSLDTEPPIKLKVAQYREFEFRSENYRVLFWQLLDGEPFTYGNYGHPPVTAIFTDIISRGLNQKPEQWFIRISANVDFERLKNDRGFQELIQSMKHFELSAIKN